MRIASLMAAAVLGLGLMGAPAPSQAAPAVPHVTTDSAVQTVVHRHGHHFRHWGHHRPGFGIYLGGGPRYGYGYGGYNRCRAWRNECGDRWGWGTWRFRRCLRNHGC